MTTVRLIADDLTGALDSAAQFTGHAPLPVLLHGEPPYPCGSYALDLSCRDGTEAAAVASARASLPSFLGSAIAFKKIDSLLRGHWAAEIAALVAASVFRQIVLAPAFPDQGRMTIGGMQWLVGIDGSRRRVAVEPQSHLAQHGVTAHRGLTDVTGKGARTAVLVCDAATQNDLVRIVEAAEALPGPTLWCGSAGLARALARKQAPVVADAPAPHLVIVGTNHPVATSQVAAVRVAQPGWLATFDEDRDTSAARIAGVLAEHGCCVAIPNMGGEMSADAAAAFIARSLVGLAAVVRQPRTLTVMGGETFAILCHGLGVLQLLVDGEKHPGVPASVMRDGSWSGLRCFSKSGAFGAPDWLVSHLGA